MRSRTPSLSREIMTSKVTRDQQLKIPPLLPPRIAKEFSQELQQLFRLIAGNHMIGVFASARYPGKQPYRWLPGIDALRVFEYLRQHVPHFVMSDHRVHVRKFL
jgi:hypothetical protein